MGVRQILETLDPHARLAITRSKIDRYDLVS